MTDQRHFHQALWRSRRGMLELDILLVAFARIRYPQLDDAGQRAYRDLLGLDDWLIWDWLQRRAAPPVPFAPIVEMIVTFNDEKGSST